MTACNDKCDNASAQLASCSSTWMIVGEMTPSLLISILAVFVSVLLYRRSKRRKSIRELSSPGCSAVAASCTLFPACDFRQEFQLIGAGMLQGQFHLLYVPAFAQRQPVRPAGSLVTRPAPRQAVTLSSCFRCKHLTVAGLTGRFLALLSSISEIGKKQAIKSTA